MFSKTKMGLILGTMAVALSVGTVFAAETATQPTVKQEAQAQHKGWLGGHKGVMGHFGKAVWDNQELLALLKTDATQLQADFKAGKSLAQIAQAQGVSEDALIQLLTKQQEDQLATAVKDGKLTQEQADKLKAGMADHLKKFVESTHQDNEKGEGFGFGHKFFLNDELLTALKLDKQGLQDQLKAGKSLAQIAQAQGVSEDALIQLLTKQHEEQLATAVKDGKLTQEQADKLKAGMADHLKKFVESTHENKGFGVGHKFFLNDELLTALKLDKQGLQDQLKAGKSLAQIAQAQGVSEDALIQLLTKQTETQLAEAVKNGKLTQDQADKMKAALTEKLKKFVENKGGSVKKKPKW